MNLRLLMSAPYGCCSKCNTPFEADDVRTDVCMPCAFLEMSNSMGKVLVEELNKVFVAAGVAGPPIKHVPLEPKYRSKLAGYNPKFNSL